MEQFADEWMMGLDTKTYWLTDRQSQCDFNFETSELPRVEAGSNTSTVALRVGGGGEKGILESETVKYGHESHVTRTREWLHWRGPATIVNDRPVLSSERESPTSTSLQL
jgi:hypothetical protein